MGNEQWHGTKLCRSFKEMVWVNGPNMWHQCYRNPNLIMLKPVQSQTHFMKSWCMPSPSNVSRLIPSWCIRTLHVDLPRGCTHSHASQRRPFQPIESMHCHPHCWIDPLEALLQMAADVIKDPHRSIHAHFTLLPKDGRYRSQNRYLQFKDGFFLSIISLLNHGA